MSEEAQHRAVLAAPLDRWRGWMLHVDCGGAGCARGRHFAVADLLPHYPGVTLEGVVAAMRCTICKGAVNKAKLEHRQRGRDLEVYWVKR